MPFLLLNLHKRLYKPHCFMIKLIKIHVSFMHNGTAHMNVLVACKYIIKGEK